MEIFWKTLGAVLIGAILTILLEKQSRDFSLLLTLAASAMVALAAGKLLSPVLRFLGQLEALGNLSNEALLVLIKIFGMGIAGELAASVCTDAGLSLIHI